VQISRAWFTLPISLSVSGPPAGASATLSTTSTSGGSTTLTVKTSNSGTVTPLGTYYFTVTGSANGLARNTQVTVKVTDGVGPTTNPPASGVFALSTLGSSSTLVRTTWSASDPSGISAYGVQRQVDGGGWSTVDLTATSTSVRQLSAFGHTYRYRVRATDGNGNTGSFAYGRSFRPYLLQESGSAIAWSGSWTTTSNSSASGGALRFSMASGAAATYSFTGSSVAWVSSRGPDKGSAKVYVDGVYMTTVSLYASTFQAKQVVYAASWGSNGSHRIGVLSLGTAGHPRIDVDAFVRILQL
jgi:hypothetical protein